MKRLSLQSWYCKLIKIVLISVILHFSFYQLKPENSDTSSPGETAISEKTVNQIDFATRRTSGSNVHHLSTMLRMVSKFTFDRLKLPEDLHVNKRDIKTPFTTHRHPFPLRI